MQKVLGYMRKACQQYGMISDGDRIAVAVSGGKDSLVMLHALSEMRRFYPCGYEIEAVTVDLCFNSQKGDYSELTAICDRLGVHHTIVDTEIARIVFDIRKESNPCSLCANMRRGALVNTAEKLRCNKLALGHNNDDVVQTFLLNLFREGRIGCFSPVAHLKNREITLIRPLVLCPEKQILSACRKCGITPAASLCPADKKTERQRVKEWLNEKERADRGIKQRLFTALKNSGIDGWCVDTES